MAASGVNLWGGAPAIAPIPESNNATIADNTALNNTDTLRAILIAQKPELVGFVLYDGGQEWVDILVAAITFILHLNAMKPPSSFVRLLSKKNQTLVWNKSDSITYKTAALVISTTLMGPGLTFTYNSHSPLPREILAREEITTMAGWETIILPTLKFVCANLHLAIEKGKYGTSQKLKLRDILDVDHNYIQKKTRENIVDNGVWSEQCLGGHQAMLNRRSKGNPIFNGVYYQQARAVSPYLAGVHAGCVVRGNCETANKQGFMLTDCQKDTLLNHTNGREMGSGNSQDDM